MFIGRETELAFLQGKYTAQNGQLVVFYGRRRVGKTETLREFCKGKPHMFYSCREVSDAEQLKAFSGRALKMGVPAARYVTAFENWEAAFGSVADFPSQGGKKLLVIDEFPYMCRANPAIPSILQAIWDEKLKDQDVMIILCGSAMGFIEKKLLGEKNPLYGRATGIYKLNAMPFYDAARFFPGYSDDDKVMAYAVLGGIPHYLRQFDPNLPLADNICMNILAKGCALYSEIEFQIRQELREASMYNTIIEAIALGNTRLNDIHAKTRIDKAKISVYLKNLMELGIAEREFAMLSSVKERAASTRGIYRLADNFFRFWFDFVFANISELEAGDAEGICRHAVMPRLSEFASLPFEDVCREYMRLMNRAGKLPFRFTRIGRWWGKASRLVDSGTGMSRETYETEIDMMAVDGDESNCLVGECKFKASAVGLAEYNQLIGKFNPTKGGARAPCHAYLFSRSGFTQALLDAASKNGLIHCISLHDMIACGA